MGKVLALANQKGGVGKTTTAVNVACNLAERGYRVLLIDLDPQGNATSSVGLDKRALDGTIYDLLVDGVDAEEIVVRDVRPQLDLIGANHLLAGAEIELTSLTRPQMRLDAALTPIRDLYDVILIDC
ncbi:MAG TPA: chromosome partitioning protein, partial [Chloroflexi bacterium]|nr:chromosome partitioning protein [Chloroflexota bacterium]